MATEREVAQIIAVIATAYPNWQPAPNTPELYYQLLGDIQTEELKTAVLHCVAESGRKFAPSIGEIRGAVGELRGMISNVPSSYQAWQEVQRQIVDVGSYRTPEFTSPVIKAAVDAMGWRNLCLSEDATADRARFIQCYEQFKTRAELEGTMLPEVRGYIEANGAKLLAPVDQIKQLSAKLSVSK
jgi:hypothetical protein